MNNRWRSMVVGTGVLLALAHAGITPLMAQPNLDEMFIAEDTDGFDPGLAIGDQFPPIRALHEGEEISSIDGFIGERGAIFIANRSADW